IEPTDKKIDIKRGASDEEVLRAIEASGLVDYLREKVKPDFFGITKAEVR
ncbi:MAG: 50S ribosomal protein L14e, partial [Pyrobaculum sp.]